MDQISLGQAELALVFLGCGALSGGWQCWAAVLQECNTPQGLEQLSGSLRTQEALPQGSRTQKDCLRM